MISLNFLAWRSERRLKKMKKTLYFSMFLLGLCCVVGGFIYGQVLMLKGKESKMMTSPINNRTVNQHLQKQLRPIRFIAYLEQDQRTWAMLMMPNGEINDVKIGSKLGLGKAKVVSISREKVVVVFPDNHLFAIRAKSKD